MTKQAPSLKELIRTFAYIGLMSFGGPAGQISLMHRLVVEEKRWIDNQRFMAALNYCMLLPGPEAQQLATYIGWLLHGKRGGALAGILFILPGLLCIFALAFAYALYFDASWITASLTGLKAAVLAVIIQALINIARRAFKGRGDLLIAALAFLAIFVFAVPFPIIVLAAALFGLLRSVAPPVQSGENALNLPLTAAKPIRLKSLLNFALIGLVLWQLPLILLFIDSAPAILLKLHLFFTKMALVTFGGAYAVLTYVAQVAVEGEGWITASTMLDGLAFAEATPGPLVLVLSFVAFLAGYGQMGNWSPSATALAAGMIATWATFVPSFLFIFIGAPLVERVQSNRRLLSAMSAITAAVVGVIANLALWFALSVLFGQLERRPIFGFEWLQLPIPSLQSLDLSSLAVVCLSLIALIRFRFNIILLLAVSLILGYLRAFYL